MACRFEYPSLVIFDCDDGRFNLFVDHMQFVNLIISTCECHVFWNDRKIFMFDHLSFISKQFPQIHLHPSYAETASITTYSIIETFLSSRIEEFSSVRLVHGKNYCYEEIFEWIMEKYGPYKLELLQIDTPYERFIQRYIEGTYTQRFEQAANCNFIGFPEIFPRTNNLGYYDAIRIYLAERTALKRLRKCKQKSLTIFYQDLHHDKVLSKSEMIFLESLCYCLQCQSSFTSAIEYSQHHCAVHNISMPFALIQKSTSYLQHEKTKNTFISGSLTEKLACPFCSSKFTSVRNWDKHIDGNHNEHNLFSETEVLNYLRMLLKMAIKQTETTKPMLDLSERIACWECSRNFSPEDRLNHYIDKHGTALRSKVIKVSNLYSNYRTAARDPVDHKKFLSNSRRDIFKCWECDEILQCDAHLLIHFLEMHTSFHLNQAIDPSRALRYRLALAQEQFAMPKRNIASTASLDDYLPSSTTLKHTDTSAKDRYIKYGAFSAAVVNSSTDYYHTKQTSIKTVIKLIKKLLPSATSVSHPSLLPIYLDIKFGPGYYLDVKSMYSCVSSLNKKSSDLSDGSSTESSDEQTLAYSEYRSKRKRTFSCWECYGKFVTTCARMIHFISKHAVSIHSKIIELSHHHNSIEVVRDEMDENKPLFRCWKCPKTCTSHEGIYNHLIANHMKSILDTNSDPLRQLENRLAAMEKDMKFKKIQIPSVKVPPNTLPNYQKSKSSENRRQYHEILATLQTIEPFCASKKNSLTKKKEKSTAVKPVNSSVHSLSNPPKDSEGFQLVTRRNLQSVSTHCQIESECSYPQTRAREYTTVTAYPSDSSNRFPCSQCSKNFRTTNDRLSHFIGKHTALPHSSTALLSHMPSNCIPKTQETTNSKQDKKMSLTEWSGCWQSIEKPTSKANLTVSFDQQHTPSILSSTTNPTSILQKKIATSQERATAERMVDKPVTESYVCSQCSKEFKSHAARVSHYKAKHRGVSLSTTNSLPKNLHEQSISIENSKPPVKSAVKITATSTKHPTPSAASEVVSISTNIHSNLERAETLVPNQSVRSDDQKRVESVFSCWICSQSFQSAGIRLEHFLKNHSSSFLPISNISSSSLDKPTTKTAKRSKYSKIAINPLTKSTSCWQCEKKFISFDYHISHFIEAHANDILFVDSDPSGILKNQLAMVQKHMKNSKDRVTPIKATSNCLQSEKKFKSASASTNKFNETKFSATPPTTYKLQNSFAYEMKTEHNRSAAVRNKIRLEDTFSDDSLACINPGYSQCNEPLIATRSNNAEHRTSISCKTSFTHTSKYDQEQRQESTGANKYSGRVRSHHLQMNSSIPDVEDISVDRDNTQCPQAVFSRLVYISWGTYRQQISVAPGKTNQCPHQLCASKMVKYTFEELSSHIFEEHEDIEVQLECCDPMVTYTPEEYNNHLHHFD